MDSSAFMGKKIVCQSTAIFLSPKSIFRSGFIPQFTEIC